MIRSIETYKKKLLENLSNKIGAFFLLSFLDSNVTFENFLIFRIFLLNLICPLLQVTRSKTSKLSHSVFSITLLNGEHAYYHTITLLWHYYPTIKWWTYFVMKSVRKLSHLAIWVWKFSVWDVEIWLSFVLHDRAGLQFIIMRSQIKEFPQRTKTKQLFSCNPDLLSVIVRTVLNENIWKCIKKEKRLEK